MRDQDPPFQTLTFSVISVQVQIFTGLDRNDLRWLNTVCARFTDSVSDAFKSALGLW